MSDITFDHSSFGQFEEFDVAAQPSPDSRQEIGDLLNVQVVVEPGTSLQAVEPGMVGSAHRLAKG